MIRTKPLPHQKTIISFAAPKEYAGIFAGYGVGKTYCALSTIEINGWRIIVVISTKTAIQSTWPDEITTHSDFFYVTLVGSSKEKLRTIKNAFYRLAAYGNKKPVIVFLTNFDGVKNIFTILAATKPQAVFIDESRKIKNVEALRSQVMWAFGKSVPHRYLMTGFPVSDGFGTEIYSQVKFLDQGATFGNSYAAFLDAYFKKSKGKWKLKPGAAKKIYTKIKDFCIMIPETVIKMPPKSYKQIGLVPSAIQQEMLDSLKNQMKIELGTVRINIDSIYALLSKSLQICDGFVFDKSGKAQFFETPKDEALIETLEEIGDEKVLIWTSFVPSLIKLQRILTRFGYGVITLYGQTDDPGKIVKAFQNSSRYNVLISTLAKGNESITLTSCRNAIYYSQSWSYDQRDNSEARIRRKGSAEKGHSSIIYTDLYLKNTVEEVVRGNRKTKEDFVKQLKKDFL